jgi:hypothetical protein
VSAKRTAVVPQYSRRHELARCRRHGGYQHRGRREQKEQTQRVAGRSRWRLVHDEGDCEPSAGQDSHSRAGDHVPREIAEDRRDQLQGDHEGQQDE